MRVRGKKKKKDERRQGETQEIMKAKLVWSLAKEKTGHSEGSCSRFANGKKECSYIIIMFRTAGKIGKERQ